MTEKTTDRYIVLFMLVLIVAIASYTAIRLASPDPWPSISDVASWEQWERLAYYDKAQSRAEQLSNDGQHAAAGQVLMDVAGMQHAVARFASTDADLVSNPRKRAEPMALEWLALTHFRRAGDGLAESYEKLLRARYPAWRSEAGSVEPEADPPFAAGA